MLTELTKLFTNKIYVTLFAITLLVNGFFVLNNILNDRTGKYVNNEVYREYSKSLLATDFESGVRFIAEEITDCSNNIALISRETSDEYLLISAYANRRNVLVEISNEQARINSANDNMQILIRNMHNARQKAIDPFEKKKYDILINRYSKLGEIDKEYLPSRGINAFKEDLWTDILILFMIYFSVYLVTAYERKLRYTPLIKATKGAVKGYIVKEGTVLFLTVIYAYVLYFERFVLTALIITMPSLGENARVFSTFCPYDISLAAYMTLFVGFKLCLFALMTVFAFAVFSAFNKIYWAIALILGVNVVGVVCSNCIDPNAYLYVINKVNIFSLLESDSLLDRCELVNVAGIPVNLLLFRVIVSISFILILSISAVFIYLRRDENSEESRGLICNIGVSSGSLLVNELQNVFVVRRAGILIMFIVALAMVTRKPATADLYSAEEVMRYRYSSDYAGVHNEETLRRISNTYDDYVLKVGQYAEERGTYEVIVEAYKQIKQYSEYLIENNLPVYIANRGFDKLTCSDIMFNRRYLVQLFSIFMSAYIFSILAYGIDYVGQNVLLLRSTRNRKNSLILRRIISYMVFLVAYVILLIPDLVKYLSKFGTLNIGAPAACLQHLFFVPRWVTIWEVVALKYIAVLPFGFLGIMLVEFLLSKLENEVAVLFVVTLISTVPVVVMW